MSEQEGQHKLPACPFAISKESISKLQEAYKKDTGVDLTWEEATDLASRLLRLAAIANRPVRRQDVVLFLERQKEFPERYHLPAVQISNAKRNA